MQLDRLRSSLSGTDSELRGDARGDGLGDTLGDLAPAAAVGTTVTQRVAAEEPLSADSCMSEEGPATGDTGVRLARWRGGRGAARLCRGLSDDDEALPATAGDQAGTAMDWRRDEGDAEYAAAVTAMLARRRLGCDERRLPLRCSMVPLRTNIDMAFEARPRLARSSFAVRDAAQPELQRNGAAERVSTSCSEAFLSLRTASSSREVSFNACLCCLERRDNWWQRWSCGVSAGTVSIEISPREEFRWFHPVFCPHHR